jgi:chemotaxis protein methyltransferase CheR
MLEAKKYSPTPSMEKELSNFERKREFEYRPADFERVRDLIYQRAGISLANSKVEMVYSRLARRLRALMISDFSSYLRLLEHADHSEWEHFVNALTTNLTDFFREPHHFPILAAHALSVPHRPICIWSAAAATGEEPYSIAMSLCEAFNSLTPPIQILATDLDTRVLAKAREGIYATERISEIAPERLKRFFLKGKGTREGFVMVRSAIRSLVEFQSLNLRDDNWSVRGPFDAIFCRNVLIYFDKPVQYRVLKRLADRLTPDGLLFAGHSENLLHAPDLFQALGKTVYRLAPGAAKGPLYAQS